MQMFHKTNVIEKMSYLDNVSSDVVDKKVLSYKVKAYKEYDGSVSYFVERGLIA